jgi:hypothetical protein
MRKMSSWERTSLEGMDLMVHPQKQEVLGAHGGTTPYLFTATGLPAGIFISSVGLISGALIVTSAAAGTATITVADYAGTSKSITISYGPITTGSGGNVYEPTVPGLGADGDTPATIR